MCPWRPIMIDIVPDGPHARFAKAAIKQLDAHRETVEAALKIGSSIEGPPNPAQITYIYGIVRAALAASPAQPIRFVDRDKAGDWTEDSLHENGRYQNTCVSCGASFQGHKRRVSCRLCGAKSRSQPMPD